MDWYFHLHYRQCYRKANATFQFRQSANRNPNKIIFTFFEMKTFLQVDWVNFVSD